MSIKIITIGRSSSNDVNINDPFVSNSHCQIIQDDKGHFRLIDTNSKMVHLSMVQNVTAKFCLINRML